MKYRITIKNILNRLKFIQFIKEYKSLNFKDAKIICDSMPYNLPEEGFLNSWEYQDISPYLVNCAEIEVYEEKDEIDLEYDFYNEMNEKYQEAKEWYSLLSKKNQKHVDILVGKNIIYG